MRVELYPGCSGSRRICEALLTHPGCDSDEPKISEPITLYGKKTFDVTVSSQKPILSSLIIIETSDSAKPADIPDILGQVQDVVYSNSGE